MKENFKRKVLKNGLTILFEKRDVPVTSLVFAVKSGGNDESLDEKGISHFIEHLLYKGTKNRTSKKIAEDIERNGGELNGFTGEETTGYLCKVPSDKFKIAIDVLSDLILNPLFDEKELEKERKVIFEEMSMRKDNIHAYVFDEIQKCLYRGTMEIDVIGTKETMGKVDRQQIYKKFKQIYTPNNFVLCVVGDANFEEIVSFVEKAFGNTKSIISKQKIKLKTEIKIKERKGIDQAHIVFAYHSPLPKDKKVYAAKVLSSIMSEGMSSRLFSEIREKRNLAYAVKGSLEAHENFSFTWIYIGTMKENLEKVKKLILTEFEKVSSELTEKELNSIKTQLIGQYKISMEDSQSQMMNLLSSEIQSKAEDYYHFEENIKKVSLEEVKELASEVKEGKYSLFALVPEN